jgi:hypothetical protein
MYRPTRRLSAALLALTLLTLLTLPAAAQAEPSAGPVDRWVITLLGGLDDLLDGLWSIDAASEVGSEPLPDDDGSKVAPRWDPSGAANELTTTRKVAPRWDPSG